MATVTGYTAAKMQQIEDSSIVDGEVVGDNLLLTRHDGQQIDAGNVRGPQGDPGTNNPFEAGDDLASASTINVTDYFHGITGTTTIQTISKIGVLTGTPVLLWIKDGPLVIENGTGNIHTLSGRHRTCYTNEILAFIWDGLYWREQDSIKPGFSLISKYVTERDAVNTVVETDFIGASGLVIPAGLLGSNGRIKATLICGMRRSAGGGNTVRLKFGSTTLITFSTPTTDSSENPLSIDVILQNLAINSQRAHMKFSVAAYQELIGGTSALDTSIDQTLRLTWQNSQANADTLGKCYSSVVEVL